MVSFLLEINGKSISIQYHAVKTTESLHEQLIISVRNPDGRKWYYHPDHLGSTSLITDQSGNVVENTFYSPYGELLGGGTSDVKLYTSQFKDNINCQYYYVARYYNPCNTQFIQPDTLIPDIYDPQSLNRYAYGLDNPYKYTDPTGQFVLSINPFALFGESSIAFEQTFRLFGETKVSPARNIFRNSDLAKELEKAGYKPLENFPKDSPIHSVTRNWRHGGMAKELGEGKWSAIRWDTPGRGAEFPHANHHLFRSGGRIGLEEFARGPLDHFPIYSQNLVSFDPNLLYTESLYSNNQQNNRQSNSNVCGVIASCEAPTSGSVSSPSKPQAKPTLPPNNNNLCGVIMSCR